MSSIASKLALGVQPVPAEHTPTLDALLGYPTGRVRRLGSVRLPLGGPYRPLATAYRLPDGRIVWCVRLWEVDRAVKRCVSSETVRRFCEVNHLGAVGSQVDLVEGR